MTLYPLQATAEVATPETSDALSMENVNEVVTLVQDHFASFALRAVGALLLLFVGFIIAGMIRSTVVKASERARVDATLGLFFGTVSKTIVIIFVLLICLGTVGVNVTSLAAVLAAAGFAVGLALQGSLQNFAAGIMLLINRPFRVGQFVEVAGVSGTVVEIQLFATTIDTLDNRRYTVPNGSIFGAVIKNVTFHPKIRVDVPVGTSYPDDIDKVREVLLAAATKVPGRVDEPGPAVFLCGFGDSSINWSVRVWCEATNYWPTLDALAREIKYGLDGAGITIPFPQMDVHLNKLSD